MNLNEFNSRIQTRIEELEYNLHHSTCSIQKKLNKEEVCFLRELQNRFVKKIYIYDLHNHKITEFISTKLLLKYFCDTLGYDIPLKTIHQEKWRKGKIAKRFYVSDQSHFDFVPNKPTETEPSKTEIKDYKNNRTSQRWFKTRTRIIPNTK